MYKLLTLIISLGLLSACSLPGTQSEKGTDSSKYTGSGFEMQVPQNWKSASGASLLTPKIGEIALAIISPDVRYGFSNNLVVVKQDLGGLITSKRYSELNYAQTSKNYLEFERVTEEGIIFGDSDTSQVYVFNARYNQAIPKLKFIQTAKVCGTTVYLIHFTVALERDAKPYIALAKTFACGK